MPHIVEVENLVKRFGQVVAVDGISFFVEQGEIFGFLGPNGAGKTTTMNILCTLSKPTAGKATVDGYDVVRQQSQVRQSIGLVFQDRSLDERLSALQNLRFHAMVYHVPASVREQRIEEVLRMMELWEKRNDEVRSYSGGMKRRLELGRGLLHYPKVLFLDEPTLGLDPQTRTRIWKFILDLRKREGTTIFLTTHYMDEAEQANRIAVIDYGKLIAMDTPGELKKIVGKDVIIMKTDDDDRAVEEIKRRYQIEPMQDMDGLHLEVANGSEFLPRLVKEFGTKILSVGLRRPSLDDAFLRLTGHEIREGKDGRVSRETVGQRHSRR